MNDENISCIGGHTMLAKRIIPCLDVKDGKVVKGTKFLDHAIVGDILELADLYSHYGADELVFYDITASIEQRTVDRNWVRRISEQINIPFCVAGGIRTLIDAERVLNAGADKISINSPALENPELMNAIVKEFGQQCLVIGVDSIKVGDHYEVCQYTGNSKTLRNTGRKTDEWIHEIVSRGAGEIVLNCMDQDGMRRGYDITQLTQIRKITSIPLIASGGAGSMVDFSRVFNEAQVDGALAASVFHLGIITIPELKQFLRNEHIAIRLL